MIQDTGGHLPLSDTRQRWSFTTMSKLSRSKKFKRGDAAQQPSPQLPGSFTQHSQLGDTLGDSTGQPSKQSPVSDTHGSFTQQSPISDTPGSFTQQSYSQQARSTHTLISQTPCPALRLKNVGNSCFANSALQLVYTIKDFREFILSRRYTQFSGNIPRDPRI